MAEKENQAEVRESILRLCKSQQPSARNITEDGRPVLDLNRVSMMVFMAAMFKVEALLSGPESGFVPLCERFKTECQLGLGLTTVLARVIEDENEPVIQRILHEYKLVFALWLIMDGEPLDEWKSEVSHD